MSKHVWASIVLYVLLMVPLIWGALAAHGEGWFWRREEANRTLVAHGHGNSARYFSFCEHAGIYALVVLNALLAQAILRSWQAWNAVALFVIFVVMVLASIKMIVDWANADNQEGKRVLSAFSRNGQLTVSGVLLAVNMAAAYTVTIMYFLSPGPVHVKFSKAFAIALVAYLPFGLLQPPYKVWGNVHKAAWQQFLLGSAAIGALYLLHVYKIGT